MCIGNGGLNNRTLSKKGKAVNKSELRAAGLQTQCENSLNFGFCHPFCFAQCFSLCTCPVCFKHVCISFGMPIFIWNQDSKVVQETACKYCLNGVSSACLEIVERHVWPLCLCSSSSCLALSALIPLDFL